MPNFFEICLTLLFMVRALKLGGVLCLNNAKFIGICFPNLPIIGISRDFYFYYQNENLKKKDH
jgi:hypothetical protein